MQSLPNQTLRFINEALSTLNDSQVLPSSLRRLSYRSWWRGQHLRNIQDARTLVLEFEDAAKRLKPDLPELEVNTLNASERYPIICDVMQVLPLFNHATLLECHRPLVQPSEIPALLYLLKIPSCGEGMDIENHGFGYHFHYGKVKGESIVRTNLLLTFDPATSGAKRSCSENGLGPPLFGEYHAEGKNKKINMETFGLNKRLPIYTVCLQAGEKRGIAKFKRPRSDAVVFHAGVLPVVPA
jgi:hypothetical protein